MYLTASEYKEIFIGLILHYYLMSIGNMLSGKSIKEITLYIPMCINWYAFHFVLFPVMSKWDAFGI